MTHLTIASLMTAAVFAASSVQASPTGPANILFIGNSYTDQIKPMLKKFPENSPFRNSHFEYITPGGVSLAQHWKQGKALQRIREGKWDWVVLQDQSQIPALPGEHGESFQKSVDEFSAAIRAVGAKPVLYMTWGRRDGDEHNRELFPDYTSMQRSLTAAYQQAASRNQAVLLPVGEAWSAVWQADRALARELYKADGSHPSAKGATLAVSVLYHVLFGDTLEYLPGASGLHAQEQTVIRDAVLGANKAQP